MRVLEYLEEIEDIVETGTPVPMTGKVMINSEEVLNYIKEIRIDLPDEIKQAQWIKSESKRIIDEAKEKYEKIIEDARRQADVMVENDDIVVKSKMRADDIIRVAEENAKTLKLRAYKHVEDILYNLQCKVEELKATHFIDMVQKIEDEFIGINEKLEQNMSEISDIAYKTQMSEEDDEE